MARHMRAPDWLRRGVEQIESDERLDTVASALRPAGQAANRDGRGAALRGEWLGHAFHPLMTDLPLGCWLSSALLDLLGGKGARRASRRLVGLGLVLVPPTVASGLADWDESAAKDPRIRRVGAVHAAGNAVVALLYLLSWRARRRDHHYRGKLLGLAGGALAIGTGYLGGHLSFARGSSVEERGLDTAGHPSSGADRRGTSNGSFEPLSDLVSVDEAALLASVPIAQVQTLVDEGLLTPAAPGPRFRRADVLAVRMVGG